MKFTVSAPGKIILAGEHAVVYGYKAIASSINLRCQAHVITKDVNDKVVALHLNNVPFDFTLTENEFMDIKEKVKPYDKQPICFDYHSILSAFLEGKINVSKEDNGFIKCGITVFIDLYFQLIEKFIPIDITITSEFSYGCGLGSSAAYSTVLSTALLLLSENLPSKHLRSDCDFEKSECELISSFAFRGEQFAHGTSSGIDNSISAFGKGILFQRSSGNMLKQNLTIPNLRVLIVDTKIKRCTKTVVKHVKKLMQVQPFHYYHWFSEIQHITESIEKLLIEESENYISEINCHIEENHRLLRLMGVSHVNIEDVISILKCYGISAKLTGAGWGGCVYGIVANIEDWTLREAIRHLNNQGYGTYVTNLSCPGVKMDI